MILHKLLSKTAQIKWIPKWISVLGLFQYFKLLTSKTSKKNYLTLKLNDYNQTIYLQRASNYGKNYRTRYYK